MGEVLESVLGCMGGKKMWGSVGGGMGKPNTLPP